MRSIQCVPVEVQSEDGAGGVEVHGGQINEVICVQRAAAGSVDAGFPFQISERGEGDSRGRRMARDLNATI